MKEYKEEGMNMWTHLIGVVFALSSIWLVWPAVHLGWQWAFGVIFFISGMFLMFLSSTLFHCMKQGSMARRVLRKLDHISIYVMIACSYTPICVSVVGGWVGWTVFGILWGVVLAGTVYKIVALDKYPKLSLTLYLCMGWSVVLIAKPVFENLPLASLLFLVSEGFFYTVGTYFFSHDYHRHYHGVWHCFVLLGALSHWAAIVTLIYSQIALQE